VQEVVRLLAADGRLDDPKTTGTWSVEIPQGIREAVERRLNHLSDDCNELLSVGAVIGREFDLGLLEKVAGENSEKVIELLDEALAARVIQEMPESAGRFRFSHALVRETLHDELNTTRRVRLHRKIGETLEALHVDHPEPHLSALAYHFAEGAHAGGDVAKAVVYSRRAGERATALLAHEDAIPHYERALQMLDLMDAADSEQRCDVLLALAWAHHYGGDVEDAIAAMEQAIPIARSFEDPRRLALVATSYGFAEFARNLAQPHAGAVALLEEVREKLGDVDSLERVQVTTQLGNQLILGETADRGEEVLREAVEIARRVGDRAALIDASFNYMFALWRPEQDAEAMELMAEMLELAESGGNADQVVLARSHRFHLFFGKGDFDACRREDAAIEELASRTQNARAMFWHHVHQATWALVEGDLEEGERLAGYALGFGMRVWNDVAMQMYGAQIAYLRYFQGRLEELAVVLSDGAEKHPYQPVWQTAAAWAYASLGDEAACRRYLEPLLADDCAMLPQDGNWPAGMSLMVQAMYEIGESGQAARLYERLLPYAERNIFAGSAATPRGPGHTMLAYLSHLEGELDRAAGHFEAAIELMERWGERHLGTRAKINFASLLLERQAEGDADRALQLLNDVLDVCREISAPKLVEEALALKLQTQGIDASMTRSSIYSVVDSVQNRRPDFANDAAADGTVTLLFSDMEGFTAMTERLGDERAHRVIQQHNRILREQFDLFGGHEVDSQGDGFLVAFTTPHDGVRAAVGIQRAFATYSESQPDEPIRVRVGLHTGQAIRDAEKFFGRTVIMACRIADQARAAEILVSADVRAVVEAEFPLTGPRELSLKGFSGTHPAYTIGW
jgi:class 3 adenylate cyclase